MGSDGQPGPGVLHDAVVARHVPGCGDPPHGARLQFARGRAARRPRSAPGGRAPLKLALRDLRIAVGERTVGDLAEVDVAEEEIVGLVGESGSGKSMTALAVLGLAAAAGATVTGSISLDGLQLVGLSERRLRDIRG